MLAFYSGGSATLSVTVRSHYTAVIEQLDSPYVRESNKFELGRPDTGQQPRKSRQVSENRH